MKNKIISLSVMALSAYALEGYTDPDIIGQPRQLDLMVITANRIEMPLNQIGSAITVITAEDIENRQALTVESLLREVPGVDVVQTGGMGRQTSVFIRGANSDQTLVLIDGVEVNDPASIGNSFQLGDLMVDSIERIEILRGSQSPLYGSDATGGVINIITKKGQGRFNAFFNAEGGDYDTFKVAAGYDGSTDLMNYRFAASRLETHGFSAADKRQGNNENDGYINTTINGNLGITPTDTSALNVHFRLTDGQTDLDSCGGADCDTELLTDRSSQLVTGLKGHINDLFDGLWSQTVSVEYSLTDRENKNRAPDAFSTLSTFEGHRFKINWQHELALVDWNTLVLGIENEEEWMKTDSIDRKSQNISGYYLQDTFFFGDRSVTTLGIRFDDNNRFGGRLTGRATQVFNINETGTRLKGSVGTGFKAPSLYQLFAPDTGFGPVGHAELKAVKSKGWDVGFEQYLWDEKIQLGASYFHNSYRDLIDFISGEGYQNIDRAKTEGVESFMRMTPLTGLSLSGSYTYTRTNDATTKARLFRRPTHKGSVDINYQFLHNANINLNVLLVGERDFRDFASFPATRVAMPGYVVANLAGSYQINPHIKLFARIDNVFDKKYQQVLGYGTSRIAGYGGVKLSY